MASTSRSRRGHILDLVFLVGVVLKGLDGLFEFAAGVALVFVAPETLTSAVQSLTAAELLEDPHDLIANLLRQGTSNLDRQGLFLIGLYLLIHGVVKLAIVVALIAGKTKVYPWAIGALTILAVVQIVDFVIHPSLGIAFLTVLDVAIIALTWREWRQNRSLRETLAESISWIQQWPVFKHN
ncbi:DUF2127 domain-containing protein [Homoserinimonas sp. OAct 916]|uniref:DUF2127 domain-containing protein n=1 Tax=Homoserinimonas sp. OAct 916 TaxID=2211450 RepID=UPI001300B118|nr:DUF2127 domain-containing protein [Homoserinimonas sp. OAct 916]